MDVLDEHLCYVDHQAYSPKNKDTRAIHKIAEMTVHVGLASGHYPPSPAGVSIPSASFWFIAQSAFIIMSRLSALMRALERSSWAMSIPGQYFRGSATD